MTMIETQHIAPHEMKKDANFFFFLQQGSANKLVTLLGS